MLEEGGYRGLTTYFGRCPSTSLSHNQLGSDGTVVNLAATLKQMKSEVFQRGQEGRRDAKDVAGPDKVSG